MIWEVKHIRFTPKGEEGLPGEPMHLIVGPRPGGVGRPAPNKALNRVRSHHSFKRKPVKMRDGMVCGI